MLGSIVPRSASNYSFVIIDIFAFHESMNGYNFDAIFENLTLRSCNGSLLPIFAGILNLLLYALSCIYVISDVVPVL